MTASWRKLAAGVVLVAALAGCEATTGPGTMQFAAGPERAARLAPEAAASEAAASTVPTPVPAMRWGERRGGDEWARETLAALESHGVALVGTVPGDVATYCPAYASQDAEARRHFWVGFLSSLAKHESTWNPQAKGGGGKWLGLMQIAPSTWRGYGCSGEILDGGDNLACAVKIMAKQVGRDGVIAGGGKHGVGRDWAPMRSSAKRADIAGWTRQQSYCTGV